MPVESASVFQLEILMVWTQNVIQSYHSQLTSIFVDRVYRYTKIFSFYLVQSHRPILSSTFLSNYNPMQGGLFGLNHTQKAFLYTSQLIPTLITLLFPNLLKILLLTQLFYLIAIYIYIRYLSLEKSYYPYYSSQLTNMSRQLKKGKELGISAFLLITIYGIIIIRIGKLVLPHFINLGEESHAYFWVCILISLINPFLEEIFWRLFLLKTFKDSYQKEHLTNLCYLLFHFTLFSTFLGFWRALPFVLTFYSIGRSMKHIKEKYGIIASILTHYGITLAGFALLLYLKHFTKVSI